MRSAEHWESEANRWAAWARAPRHDAYWYYRDAFFALLPPPGRATLEVGFGEGRVSRDLVARGHRVTGVVVSPTLARLAAEADPTARYLLADGAALPSPLRLCAASGVGRREVRRAGPGGDVRPRPTYFGPRPSAGTFERDGLSVTFRGWCYFLIEALREPLPGPTAPPTTRGRRLPIFLMMRLLKSR